MNVCRFDAISGDFHVDPVSCEGCTVCSFVCPAGAITMEENVSGEWFISETKYGPMVHARLGIAEENSGKLVSLVRQEAKRIADEAHKDYVIIDGPPGIGCPVIASLANVDLALIVTEPTLSGIHDMERITGVSKHFNVTTKVVINKYDLNINNSEEIRRISDSKGIEVLARLPFSQKVSQSIVQGTPLVEFCNDEIVREITHLWEKIQ
jgi:MinD superfamily P-loop ATPase